MLRTFILSLTAGAFVLAGCGAPATSGETTSESTNEALSSFGAKLVGNFHRTDGGNALSALSLRKDGSYGSDEIVECFRAPCDPIHTEGRWSASGFGSYGTLSLTPDGDQRQVYGVKVVGADASLDLTARGTKTTIHEGRDAQTCGGIAALQCPAGQTCVMPDGPTYPDESGHCEVVVHGATCGGIAGLPCPAGQTCVMPAGPTYPDEAGECKAIPGVGSMCGGIAAIQCPAGLHCVITATYPDASGTCQ